MPPISQVCNDRPSSIIDEDGRIPSADSGWCIANICEIYEMQIHDLFMSIWIRSLCTANEGRPDVTLVGVAAHDVLIRPFLPPGKSLWNLYLRDNLIGFDNWHCIWNPVVYMGVILYPLRHRADVETKVSFLSRPRRDHWVGSRDESKSFEIIFLCRSVREYFNLPIGPFVGNNCPLGKFAIHTPMHAASLSHTVHQISIVDYSVTYERVNT